MEVIPFTKMSGVGNDFIVVDNQNAILAGIDVHELARVVCRRRVSLGADELILIEPPTAGGDFSMRTINPDGGEVNMCGNAARCIARYACDEGLAGSLMTIDTRGGPVRASVDGPNAHVELQITSPAKLGHRLDVAGATNTANLVEVSGLPHAVLFLDGVAEAPDDSIHALGAAICHHPEFEAGTNVDMIEVLDRHTLWQRTFERGVEGETLACGTGAVASSVVCATMELVESPVKVNVLGGELGVSFERKGFAFTELRLSGEVRYIARGHLHPEAWTRAYLGD